MQVICGSPHYSIYISVSRNEESPHRTGNGIGGAVPLPHKQATHQDPADSFQKLLKTPKNKNKWRRPGLSCCRAIWLQLAPPCQLFHSHNLPSFLVLLLFVWQVVTLPRLGSGGRRGAVGANSNDSKKRGLCTDFCSMASAFKFQRKQFLNLF